MARPIEEPVVTVEGPEYRRVEVTRHPAYGQISAGRVSGGSMLYGSDFQHQSCIRIHVKTSELQRNLSNDTYRAHHDNDIVELDLSEAQWATFVSSLNVGMGVPCTLTRVAGKSLPGLPDPPSKDDQFKKEAARQFEKAKDALQKLAGLIDASKLSQKDKKEMLSGISQVSMNIGSNVSFVLGQFAEHMDDQKEKAKIEINAYVTAMAMQTGIAQLAGGASPIALEG